MLDIFCQDLKMLYNLSHIPTLLAKLNSFFTSVLQRSKYDHWVISILNSVFTLYIHITWKKNVGDLSP